MKEDSFGKITAGVRKNCTHFPALVVLDWGAIS
jgi:hypothetical protein